MNVGTIILGIIIISFLALIHEIGHFLAAKSSKIGVEEFSIGFGPTIAKKNIKGTEYKLGLLPILGYVKIKGMEGDFNAPDGFFKQNLFKRFITLFMGPFMNFVAAVVIFAFVFTSFGNPFVPSTTVASVASNSPAAAAQILPKDKIIKIDNVVITSWQDITTTVQNANGKTLTIELEREGKTVTVEVTPKKDTAANKWVIGIYSQGEKYNFFRSFYEGIKWTLKALYQMFILIPMLFTRQGISSIAGPIGIISMTGEAASGGFASLLWFTAYISIALGFTNLLPIPALDGSWIVLVIWEAITRKPVPPEKQASVQGVGFIFVLGLMLLVSIRDILRVIGK